MWCSGESGEFQHNYACEEGEWGKRGVKCSYVKWESGELCSRESGELSVAGRLESLV